MSIRKLTFFLSICIFIKIFNPLYADELTNTSWSYYFKKGILQYKAQMYNDAILNLQKALYKNPKNFSSANLLGSIYFKKKNYPKSLQYYGLSIQINEKQEHVHYILGDLYENYFYDNDKALFHYSKSIKNTSNVKGYLGLARVYYKNGDYRNYNKYYNRSYKNGSQRSKPLYDRALEYKNNGYYRKAIVLFKKAIKENPAMIEAYIALYNIYRSQNNYLESVTILQKLYYNRPDYINAYLFCAKIYFNKKLPGNSRQYYINKAISNLNTVLKLAPYNYDACILLSRIYFILGQHIKSQQYEKRARAIEQKQKVNK